jgi:acetyltransferase-like isoleucine patch superfamily enzyme
VSVLATLFLRLLAVIVGAGYPYLAHHHRHLSALFLPGPHFLSALYVSVAAGWILFWMRWAGSHGWGRLATRVATWWGPRPCQRHGLARLYPRGYVAPSTTLGHDALTLGKHPFLGEQVVCYQAGGGGPIRIGDGAAVHLRCLLETGNGAEICIGSETTIQRRCLLIAHLAAIRIGARVTLSPGCALYSFDHGMTAGQPLMAQPLTSKGDIVIADDAWLGDRVVVLSGVRIGRQAMVLPGSVVTRDVPDGMIAAGAPAQVIGPRRAGGRGQYGSSPSRT